MADLSSVIRDQLGPAINDHDLDRVLQCFDDNAVINFNVAPPGLPNTLKGKNDIRRFFEMFMKGMHVEPISFKTQGDRVEWTGRLSNDMLRNSGLKEVETTNWATIKNNKIVSFNPSLPSNVTQALQQQGTQTGTRPTQR